MITISFEVPQKYVQERGRGPIVFVIVLERENLDRMKEADPADLQLLEYLKGPILNAPLKQLNLVIAYEEDLNELLRIKKEGNAWDLIRWLERGRKIIPGDVTQPVPFRKN